jgi:hypothetical protein
MFLMIGLPDLYRCFRVSPDITPDCPSQPDN